MKKKILIPLEEYNYIRTAVEYGLDFASGAPSQLTGLSIIDLPSIEKSIGPIPAGSTYYARKEEKTREVKENKMAQGLIAEFKKCIKEKNTPGDVIIEKGDPEELIISESMYYDLIILGQKTSFRFGSSEDDSLQQKIVSHGICPVLIIPREYRHIEKILICFDGSIQATKAIHALVHSGFSKQRQLILLNVSSDVEKSNLLLNKMGEYLSAWDMAFEKVRLEGDVDEMISSYVNENDVDLVVLGAYGKNVILKFIFGSVTKKLIKISDRPLFIFH